MARRPQGSKSVVLAADGSVKATPGIVYAFNVAFEGATAGDNIALRDGGALGTVKAYYTVPEIQGTDPQSGTFAIDCGKYGIEFATSIFFTEQAAAANKIRATIVYD